jgi:hypothetical protein
MPPMAARLALALAALCAAAFLALQLYAHERLQAGQEPAFLAGQRALEPGLREEVLDDLDAAEPFRPGTDALIAAALVRLRAGDEAGAERLARRAVDREPRNFAGYDALAASLRGRDPEGAARAARRSRELNPLTP